VALLPGIDLQGAVDVQFIQGLGQHAGQTLVAGLFQVRGH